MDQMVKDQFPAFHILIVSSGAACFGAYANLFKYKYQLRAVSVHIGQAHSGHFITYRRGIGYQNRTSWFRTSDTDVSFYLFLFPKANYSWMSSLLIKILQIHGV